jgi:hypothetical protein
MEPMIGSLIIYSIVDITDIKTNKMGLIFAR